MPDPETVAVSLRSQTGRRYAPLASLETDSIYNVDRTMSTTSTDAQILAKLIVLYEQHINSQRQLVDKIKQVETELREMGESLNTVLEDLGLTDPTAEGVPE